MNTYITILLLFIMHRGLSGVRNGMGYQSTGLAGKMLSLPIRALIVAVMGVSAFAGLMMITPNWCGWGLFWTSVAASCLALLYRLSGNKYLSDLHLLTLIEQSALAGAYILSDFSIDMFAVMCCAVWPSVTLQKAVINAFIGEEWYFDGTDDPAGRWYSLPSLGIRVPRLTQRVRLVLSVCSLFAFVLYFVVKS